MKPRLPVSASATAFRIYHVAYSAACDADETPRLHHTRDAGAAAELNAALAPHGGSYETALNFYPATPRPEEKFSFLRASDMLVLPTRPPLEYRLGDGVVPFTKGHRHSQNLLEVSIFEAVAPFFDLLGRPGIELSQLSAGWLKKEDADYSALEFTKNSHALISRHGRYGLPASYQTTVNPTKARHTAGYFIKLRQLPRFPCGLVCCFAPGGVENLLFARLVRRCHAAWLAPRWQGFCVVRFNVPAAAEEMPLTATAFDSQIVETVLIEQTFEMPPTRPPSTRPPPSTTRTPFDRMRG